MRTARLKRTGLLCGSLSVLILAGCPVGPPSGSPSKIPVLPSQVDPPIVQPVPPSGTTNVVIVSDGTVLEVYINGQTNGTVTVQNGAVDLQVPSTLAAGHYALALYNAATREIVLTRILEVP